MAFCLLFSSLSHYEAFIMLVIIQRCSCCSQTHAAQPYNALCYIYPPV
uniref:Uncharacterized protein n=1 Tax=Zonotrichia albicollis TaxID=44394 RepID=A0A8D2MXL7_ZONAL